MMLPNLIAAALTSLYLLFLLGQGDGAAFNTTVTAAVTGAPCEGSGPMPQTDLCEFCVCSEGRSFCSRVDCFTPCVDSVPPARGTCCRVCPNGTNNIGWEYEPRSTVCESPNCKTREGLLINGTEPVFLDPQTKCWCDLMSASTRALCVAS